MAKSCWIDKYLICNCFEYILWLWNLKYILVAYTTLQSELRSSFSHHILLYVLVLYISVGNYSLKYTQKPYMTILFTIRGFGRNLLKWSRQRNIFPYLLLFEVCLIWGLNRGLTSNEPTHYLSDHCYAFQFYRNGSVCNILLTLLKCTQRFNFQLNAPLLNRYLSRDYCI